MNEHSNDGRWFRGAKPPVGAEASASDGSVWRTTATPFLRTWLIVLALLGIAWAQAAAAPPVANPDSYSVHANQVLTVPAASGLLANDTDSDGDPISVVSIQSPSNGFINTAADDSFAYTPNAGFVGSEFLDYTISDGRLTATTTFTLEVVATQQVPAVPTLGSIGVIVLAMLVMAMGILVIRRKDGDNPA